MNHVLHQLRGLGKGERVGKIEHPFFFVFLQEVQWPSAGSMEVFQQIHFNLAGKLAHGHCCLQAVIHNRWPQDPVQSRGSFLHFLMVGAHVFLLLGFTLSHSVAFVWKSFVVLCEDT